MSEVVHSSHHDAKSSPRLSQKNPLTLCKQLGQIITTHHVFSETRRVFNLLLRVVNDPLGESGNWVEMTSGFHHACDREITSIGGVESWFSDLENSTGSGKYRCISTGELTKLSRLLADRIDAVENLLDNIFHTYHQRFPEQSYNPLGPTFLQSASGEDDDHDECSPMPGLPLGTRVEDLQLKCRGATRYARSFAMTISSLYQAQPRERAVFDLREIVSETLAPQFVGSTTTPDSPLYIAANRNSLKTATMLIVGALNYLIGKSELGYLSRQTDRLFRSRDRVEDPLLELGDPSCGQQMTLTPEGNLLFSVSDVSREIIEGKFGKRASDLLQSIADYYRIKKEYFIEVDFNAGNGSVNVCMISSPLRTAGPSNPVSEISLSGLHPPPLLDEDSLNLTLPWTPSALRSPLNIEAKDSLWQSPIARKKIFDIARGAAQITGDNSSIDLISIELHSRRGKLSEVTQFLRNKCTVILYGEPKSYPYPSAEVGMHHEPRFFTPRTTLRLHPDFCCADSLSEVVTMLIANTSCTIINLSDPVMSTLTSPRRRDYFIKTLQAATKLAKTQNKSDESPSVQISIEQLIMPFPRARGVQPSFAQHEAAQEKTKIPLLSIQLFDHEGRRLSAFAVSPGGRLRAIAFNHAQWCTAFNYAIEAFRLLDKSRSTSALASAFASMGLAVSVRMLNSLANAAVIGEIDYRRTLAAHFLHPSFMVQSEMRTIYGDDPTVPPKQACCYNLGLPGETIRVLQERVLPYELE